MFWSHHDKSRCSSLETALNHKLFDQTPIPSSLILATIEYKHKLISTGKRREFSSKQLLFPLLWLILWSLGVFHELFAYKFWWGRTNAGTNFDLSTGRLAVREMQNEFGVFMMGKQLRIAYFSHIGFSYCRCISATFRKRIEQLSLPESRTYAFNTHPHLHPTFTSSKTRTPLDYFGAAVEVYEAALGAMAWKWGRRRGRGGSMFNYLSWWLPLHWQFCMTRLWSFTIRWLESCCFIIFAENRPFDFCRKRLTVTLGQKADQYIVGRPLISTSFERLASACYCWLHCVGSDLAWVSLLFY